MPIDVTPQQLPLPLNFSSQSPQSKETKGMVKARAIAEAKFARQAKREARHAEELAKKREAKSARRARVEARHAEELAKKAAHETKGMSKARAVAEAKFARLKRSQSPIALEIRRVKACISMEIRRTRLKNNGGSFTFEEIIAMREAQNHQCAYCQRVIKLTIDHIFPVSKGGSSDISNICLACRKCNSSKGAKLLEEWVNRWYERDRF